MLVSNVVPCSSIVVISNTLYLSKFYNLVQIFVGKALC